MTRFARIGQNRKRAHDATDWNDLKGSSTSDGEKQMSSGTSDGGPDKEVAGVSHSREDVTDTSGPGDSNRHGNRDQRSKFEKGKGFSKKDKGKRVFECYNCRGKDHKASECPQPSDGKNDNIVCHACKELGHKAFRCPNSQGSGSKGAGGPQKSEHKAQGRKWGFGQKGEGRPGKFNKRDRPLQDAWNKEKRSEWRRQKRENEREAKKHCFNCRSAGHQLSECPELQKDAEQGTGICFKCGSTEHSIYQCNVKMAKDKFPFAKCFICNETGHLSKQCPDNPRGLYPDGGCCKQCGSVEHLKRDCPEYQSKQGIGDMTLGRLDTVVGGDTEDLPVKKMKKTSKPSGPKTVKF